MQPNHYESTSKLCDKLAIKPVDNEFDVAKFLERMFSTEEI